MDSGVCEVNHEIIVDTLQRLFVYVKLIDIYSIVQLQWIVYLIIISSLLY